MGEKHSTVLRTESITGQRAYGQLLPNKCIMTPFTFPLFESKTYSIGCSESSDYRIPAKLKDGESIILRVGKNGDCEIENLTDVAVTVNEKEVKKTQKKEVSSENCRVQVGDLAFAFRRNEVPSTTMLKSLYSNLQCSNCLQFSTKPVNLTCSHIICNSCFTKSVNEAFAKSAELSKTTRTIDAYILCPKCKKKFSVAEATELKDEPAVSSVATFFTDLVDDRPVCAMCQNQRWITHGSDYVYCTSCNSVVCPLCALDGHREHSLKSNFDSAFRSCRDFGKKTAQVKEDWKKLCQSIEAAFATSSVAKQKLTEQKFELNAVKNLLDDKLFEVKELFKKLTSLEAPSFSEDVEKERNEILQLFEQGLTCIQDVADELVEKLKIKAENVLSYPAVVECMTTKKLPLDLDTDENAED